MKSGQCPKCNCNNVFSGADVSDKKLSMGFNTIPIGSLWKYPALDNYVCVDCGYVESYISNKKALEYIAKKWPRAGS